MFEQFIGRLALLYHARQRVAENKARRDELMGILFADHIEFFEGIDVADEALKLIEAKVRAEGLSLYNIIPNLEKTSIPGVTIRESKVVGFSPETALEWAIEHGIALKLDEASYKKLVLAGQAPGSVDVALTVAIAADLSEFAT